MFLKEQICNGKQWEKNAGDTVKREKGNVNPAQIVVFDDGMLIKQQKRKYSQPNPVVLLK